MIYSVSQTGSHIPEGLISSLFIFLLILLKSEPPGAV